MKFDLKFSIIDMMRDRLHAAPFQPFVVVLHSGERLRVKNPDVLTVTLSGWVIYDEGAKARMLNPALVAEIETKSVKVWRNSQSVPRATSDALHRHSHR